MSDNKEIMQDEAKEYLKNSDDDLNSMSDLGHSYSYQSQENDKLRANINFMSDDIKKVIEEYKDIINCDSNICDKISELDNYLKNIDCQEINKEICEKNFNELLILVDQVGREDERIEGESPAVSRTDISFEADKLFELKRELERLRENALEIY